MDTDFAFKKRVAHEIGSWRLTNVEKSGY